MPQACRRGPPSVHPKAVAPKTSTVSTRSRVQGTTSASMGMRWFSRGRNTNHKVSTIRGINTATNGNPMRNHPAKSTPAARAASALGGEPTKVPKPPRLAA